MSSIEVKIYILPRNLIAIFLYLCEQSSMICGRLSTGPAAVFKILRIGLACQAAVIIVVALQFR